MDAAFLSNNMIIYKHRALKRTASQPRKYQLYRGTVEGSVVVAKVKVDTIPGSDASEFPVGVLVLERDTSKYPTFDVQDNGPALDPRTYFTLHYAWGIKNILQ